MSDGVRRSGYAEQAVLLHHESGKRLADRLSLQWGVVTAVAGGLVKFRPLAAVDPTLEEYAHIGPVLPVVGDNIAYALLGSSWVVVGVIRSSANPLNTLDGPLALPPLYVADAKPGIAPAAGAGAGASASVVWGNDTLHYVIVNIGTSGTAIGPIATVSFTAPRLSTNYAVWIQEMSANSVDTGRVYAGAQGLNSYALQLRVAATVNNVLHYACFVAGSV